MGKLLLSRIAVTDSLPNSVFQYVTSQLCSLPPVCVLQSRLVAGTPCSGIASPRLQVCDIMTRLFFAGNLGPQHRLGGPWQALLAHFSALPSTVQQDMQRHRVGHSPARQRASQTSSASAWLRPAPLQWHSTAKNSTKWPENTCWA